MVKKLLIAAAKFVKKLFTKKRAPKFVDYDTTQVKKTIFTPQGPEEVDAGLTPEADKKRRELLKTKLEEGDSYRLGPSAIVKVGPNGAKGKAWAQKQVAAAEERRQKRWEAKRERCVALMMMSEQELRDSGVWDEVMKFVNENQKFAEEMAAKGLLPRQNDEQARNDAKKESQPPSGEKDVRVKQAFMQLAGSSGLHELELPSAVAVGAGPVEEKKTIGEGKE